jgi:eukaryotic-like serine/threonine-protein kinase
MRLLEEGMLIRDTYEVERFLGEGAFAEVYRVKHRYLGRQAMKVFKQVGMSFEEMQELLSEAILLSKLAHPNIVRVFDANVFETKRGTCGYFTMENVPGGTLHKFWQSYGGRFVPIDKTVDLMKQVCRGIAQAHRENPPIIHRDIKPQNILVGYEADGLRARVSDFGLAKNVNPLTLMASVAGTRLFKPPEAFLDYNSDSCAGDVWAIGVTLYMLLTDRLPVDFPSNSSWGSQRVFNKPIIPPSEINPDINKSMDRIILKSLEKKPDDRYPTAKALLDALENWNSEAPQPLQKPKMLYSEPSKAVLGTVSPANEKEGHELVRQAFEARRAGRLAEAADIMEEAFNKSPDLRERYAQQVKMWRRGVSM